ncbi:MAG: hypothetical protein AAF802_23475 [Planctomycetota bacterium]
MAQRPEVANETAEVDTSEFPPPQELADLIEKADVTIVTGKRPRSNRPEQNGGGRLAGETTFEFNYEYSSRVQWRPTGRNDDRRVEVTVRFRKLKLKSRHQVWLRRPPKPENFWEDALVRHEFDHVKISSHPVIQNLFVRLTKRLTRFEIPLRDAADRYGRVSQSRVEAIVDERIREVVDEVAEYVRIRYRELDRTTRHGILPLPDDFALQPNL